VGNILRFALQMELDGKNFYHRLALHVKASDHKKVLFSLAADEEKHYQKLKTVQSTDKHRFLKSEQLAGLQNVFREQIFVVNYGQLNIMEIYQLALRFEELSVLFYRGLAESSLDKAVTSIFKQLAEEEEEHRQQIWQLIQLLSRSEEWYPYLDL
jgi:rubrerythrin